jgi:hypothetical protein
MCSGPNQVGYWNGVTDRAEGDHVHQPTPTTARVFTPPNRLICSAAPLQSTVHYTRTEFSGTSFKLLTFPFLGSHRFPTVLFPSFGTASPCPDLYCLELSQLLTTAQSQSQSHFTSECQYVLMSSPFWFSWPYVCYCCVFVDRDQILFSVCKLLFCFCGEPSLTRGRVCLLSVTVSSI